MSHRIPLLARNTLWYLLIFGVPAILAVLMGMLLTYLR